MFCRIVAESGTNLRDGVVSETGNPTAELCEFLPQARNKPIFFVQVRKCTVSDAAKARNVRHCTALLLKPQR
jgi:hypothetical protein